MPPPLKSRPAAHWKLRTRSLDLGPMPRLMGIVNVTPDSFSDGGRFLGIDAAVEHGLRLVAEGADLLDIGGESTRPGADPVDAREELRRVLPVVEALRRKTDVPLSIDTSKAAVAKEAIAAGVEIINDIASLAADPAMLPLAVETGCGICIMHMQGEPRTMQLAPVYADVVSEVLEYLRGRRDAIVAAGVEPQRIAVDPGIGFGKKLEHNLLLLTHADQFHSLGCPVLIGPSRKRFIAELLAAALPPSSPTPTERLGGTIGAALSSAQRGVQVLRVHDVAAVRQSLLLFQAAGGFPQDVCAQRSRGPHGPAQG